MWAGCARKTYPGWRGCGIYVTTIPVYQLWKNADRYLEDPDGGETAVPHRMLMRGRDTGGGGL